MATVLISGGNGLIGRHLCRRLKERGYDVVILSRTKKKGSPVPVFTWDWEKMEMDPEAIFTADYIIHLAGVNIGEKRWTARRKKEIVDSRVKTAQLIHKTIKEQKKVLRAFISASAIGYYGAVTSDKIHTESDPPADDFLGDVCKKWEQAASRFKESGIRTVAIRTGVVLTKEGGILSRLMMPVQLGLGSSLGNGRQYMPWIHVEDLCGIYIKAIEDDHMEGPYNAVAPDDRTNKEFTRTMARICKKSLWLPGIPSVFIRLLFGKMSDMLLKGSRVSPNKIRQAGYSFIFPTLESALKDLICKEPA
jgi:uncharacterized protein (TIGR01777 family)